MLELFVFLVVLAFIRLMRRTPRTSTVRIEVHHYHHGDPGPGEHQPVESNIVPFRRRDAA